MDSLRPQRAQGIINEAVPANAVEPRKTRTAQPRREVPAFKSTGVARMQMTVVDDLDGLRRQRLTQTGFDPFAARHDLAAASLAAEVLGKGVLGFAASSSSFMKRAK